jgi:hypothetical protein
MPRPAAHLQIGHRVAVLHEQLTDEPGGVCRGVHEVLAVAAPARTVPSIDILRALPTVQ